MTSPRKGERGHLLVGLMIWVAILMIFSTVATQAWVDVLRRDNEAEMIFRAQEIVRALKKYQKDRGTLPTTLDQLIEPGSRGQYFLRRLYKDPLTKSGKWILLYSGPDGSVIDALLRGVSCLREEVADFGLGLDIFRLSTAMAALLLGMHL